MLALRRSVLLHGWTVKVTARVRYLRSTTETERKPAQGTNDVLKLCQPTLCLDPRQLTASLSLKNPTQADRVIMLIIFIMLIMRIMVIVYDYEYYANYGNYAYYADYFVNPGLYQFGSCGSCVAEQAYRHYPGG